MADGATARPAGGRTHVTLHGFGEFAVVYKHLIDVARERDAPIDFSIVLPTSHHVALLSTVLPADRIFCLEDEIGRYDALPPDLDELAHYPGSIHRDVDADKRDWQRRPGALQTRQALATYRAYRDMLLKWRPDHVLFAHVESFEQKMMTALVKELGIPASVPIDARIFGGSFMCSDVQETLPDMPFDPAPHRAAAEALVARFRAEGMSAVQQPFPPEARTEQLSRHVRPLKTRAVDFVRRSLKHPERYEPDALATALMNNLPAVRDAVYNRRIRRALAWHDAASLDELPAKFIYYPLQYTPESSINTPAPYFVDQLRVVDAIRHAMPSDHVLVVKDHPAVLRERKKPLIDTIRRRSGTILMKATVPGREIIKRAALTISVTGTSTLEAFLLGRPALTLGGMFMSRYFGGVVPLSDLEPRIRAAIASPPTDEQVIGAAADILALKRPFSIFQLQLAGDPVYNKTNIVNMLAALQESILQRSPRGPGA
jgi:hypothetical protein